MMNPRGLTLAALLALAASPVFALSLNDAANAVAGGAGTGVAPAETATLLNELGGQLQVTPAQAIGGAGALFGLARNRLSGAEYSQLSQAVPGLELLSNPHAIGLLGGLGGLLGPNAGGALGNPQPGVPVGQMNSMADVDRAFAGLGMDGGLIAQFAPLILQYLGQQGIAASLLQSLGSLWQWTAPPAAPVIQTLPVGATAS